MPIRKAIQIGSSVGITIPKQFLHARKIAAGDDLSIDESANGILIRPVRADAKRSEKVAELTLNFVNRYRSDLEALKDK